MRSFRPYRVGTCLRACYGSNRLSEDLEFTGGAGFKREQLMALALRPNRIKNRDLWGITWLRQQAVDLPLPLIVKKIADHKQTTDNYSTLLEQRIAQLQSDTTQQASFNQEMRRFLPPGVAKRTVESAQFWEYLCTTVVQEGQGVLRYLANESPPNDHFKM